MNKENKPENFFDVNNILKPQIFHALPLRDVVIFPHMTTTILVGRERSVKGIEEVKKLNLPIFAVAQTNPDHDEFDEKSIHKIGVLCNIIESTKMADGTLKVVIHGIIRGQVNKILENKDVFACMIDIITDQPVILEGNKDILGLIKSCVESFSKLAEFNKKISKLKLPKEVDLKCRSEIAKLEKMNPYSSESGVIRNYLDWIVELPWHEESKPNNDFKKAQKIF